MSDEHFDALSVRRLTHEPARDGSPICSNDFLVNGQSLLQLLGHGQRAGCFVSHHERRNTQARKRLLRQAEPDTPGGRVLIYACTCCGDLGCGGLAVRVTRDDTAYIWSDFALESRGPDAEKPITHIGPFRFQRGDYVTAIHNAALV